MDTKKDKSYEPGVLSKVKDLLVGTAPLLNPLAGPPCALLAALATWRSQTRLNRIEDIIKDYGKAIEALGEHKLDYDMLESEDFQLTAALVVDKAMKARTTGKRDRFRKILLNIVNKEKASPQWDRIDIYMGVIEELDDYQIEIFSFIYKLNTSYGGRISTSTILEKWAEKHNLEKGIHSDFSLFKYALRELENNGLIGSESAWSFGGETWKASYHLSSFGSSFYDFVIGD